MDRLSGDGGGNGRLVPDRVRCMDQVSCRAETNNYYQYPAHLGDNRPRCGDVGQTVNCGGSKELIH